MNIPESCSACADGFSPFVRGVVAIIPLPGVQCRRNDLVFWYPMCNERRQMRCPIAPETRDFSKWEAYKDKPIIATEEIQNDQAE